MSLLRRLLGSEPTTHVPTEDVRQPGRPDWIYQGAPVTLYPGGESLECVGESFYQEALWSNVGGSHSDRVRESVIAILVPEPENPHDKNAVAVWVGGWKVAHLSREDAIRIQPGLIQLMESSGQAVALDGRIVGGGHRADGLGNLGIWLDYNPEDFGLQSASGERGDLSTGQIRTGLGSRDWHVNLPDDQLRAITTIRKLLESEHNPIERHFMYSELSRRLYRARDAFPSVLLEFDAVCERHHAEMASIRPALIAEFGGVPVIEFYRQAAIRCQKARRWGEAIEWCRRGLDQYGADGLVDETPSDLRQRMEKYRRKIDKLDA